MKLIIIIVKSIFVSGELYIKVVKITLEVYCKTIIGAFVYIYFVMYIENIYDSLEKNEGKNE